MQEQGHFFTNFVKDQLIAIAISGSHELVDRFLPNGSVTDRIPHHNEAPIAGLVHKEELVLAVDGVIVDIFVAQKGEVTGLIAPEFSDDCPDAVSRQGLFDPKGVSAMHKVAENQDHDQQPQQHAKEAGKPNFFPGEEEKARDLVLGRVGGGIHQADKRIKNQAAGENGTINDKFAEGVLEFFPVDGVAH